MGHAFIRRQSWGIITTGDIIDSRLLRPACFVYCFQVCSIYSYGFSPSTIHSCLKNNSYLIGFMFVYLIGHSFNPSPSPHTPHSYIYIYVCVKYLAAFLHNGFLLSNSTSFKTSLPLITLVFQFKSHNFTLQLVICVLYYSINYSNYYGSFPFHYYLNTPIPL